MYSSRPQNSEDQKGVQFNGSETDSCVLLSSAGGLFALKVVNNHYNPGGVKYIMGVPVANRYACWVELILIHIMNPG